MAKREPKRPTPSANEIRPSARQEEFLACTAREILFGGSAGGGKTESLILQPLARVSLHHYEALAIRRTFPELEASFIERSKAIYPRLGGTYNEQRKAWRWRGAGKVSFGYVDGIDDTARYQSSEFQDIIWDELTTHKKGDAYEFLFSRLRSPYGYPGYVRAGSNPGGKGHKWVFTRFAMWLWEPGVAAYPGALTDNGEIPRPRPGQSLWIRKDLGGREWVTHRRWHDPKCILCRPKEPCFRHAPVSRCFIPSRVTDNKFLAGGEYEATLHNLPPIERARLLNGDWNIMPAAGMYFKRSWCTQLEVTPSDVIARVRYWDRAATEGGGDWTVGVLMSVRPGPVFVVEHVERKQFGPGGVEKLIKDTAATDPLGTIVALEQDPGQAGKVEIWNYAKQLRGFAFLGLAPQGDKLTRARPVSAQAHVGNVLYVAGPWNEAYWAVLEGFEGDGDEVDDDVDATSGAFRVLLAEYERRMKRGSGGGNVHLIGLESTANENSGDDVQ